MASLNDGVPVATTGLTFDDEFNTFTSSQDGSSGRWMTNYPYGGEAAVSLAQATGEQEYYSSVTSGPNSPFSLSDGVLDITATQAWTGYGLPYTSGLITTYKSFSQQYGYFEVNAKLPDGAGLWPAFWMMPSNNSAASELDIFEMLGANPSTINSTTHGSYYNNGISQAFSVADTSTAFHTYGVDWQPDTVTFYMDGVKLGSAPTPATMNSPMYMLLNLGVGGASSWGGAPNASTVFPATMQINWVRAFSTAATNVVSGSAALTPSTQVLGAGNDTLAFSVDEDAYKGDAQFTISVDGVQIGGVQTTTASRSASQLQTFDVQGNFGPGKHTVAVDFLNDAYGGSPSADRNLYLTQATLNGSTIVNSSLALYSGGAQSFGFTGDGTAVNYQPTTVIGSGVDVLALHVSEDAYLGDAQFTVSVDGKQVGGTQTAAALHNVGGAQELDVLGTFAPGAHTVSVNFLNGAPSGSPSLGRNLYLNSATLDGTSVASSSLAEYSNGAQSFSFQKAATDTLTLGVSEDAYQGDAQYRVLVDGVDTGNTYTATASHAAGQITQQTVTGNWGAGPHQIGVQFINDAWGGSSSLDRNLYINSASYDGKLVGMAPTEQASNGIATVSLPVASNLTLHLAEDAYQGDAQFIVTVDGQQIDQPTPVSALHAAGASQAFDFEAYLAPDSSHDVGVTFLNDAWGGSPALDRNLFVMGADLNGTSLNPSSWTTALYSNGTQHFSLNIPS